MILGNLFYEISAILIIAAGFGFAATFLRQPLIVAFIVVGILVGPAGIDLITAQDELALLAEIGIALLLFVVGLKLDLHLIRNMGVVALVTGMGQVIFTSVFGFLIALALGMETISAAYVAVALTFSSTIIIVKLLSDKREIDSLHGRIAIGFLIVQDIAVILAMIGLTALGAGGEEESVLFDVLDIFIKGVLFLIAIGLLMRFVLPPLLNQLARSQELLLLFAISWAVFLATAGDYLGFSKEVGAFLAGISIASTHYRETIGSRLVSLRDFLLLFFFIKLGSTLDLGLLGDQLGAALLFSAFVLIGNPLIVMGIMGVMGYRKRTGFLAGLTVAQISEFSLILGALGMSLGHIDPETMGLITLVGLITIGLSTYLILYSYPIYNRLAPFLDLFQRKIPHREGADENLDETEEKVDVILFGLGRYGRNIARNLLSRGKKVLGVDFDPAAVEVWRSQGQPARYGDAEDPDVFEHLPWNQARWIVNATPGVDTNLILLRALRERGYRGKVVLTAATKEEANRLSGAGADKVLHPYVDAAEQAADSLTATLEKFTHHHPWPVTVAEVRLRLGARAGGKRISQLDLRSKTGASIVAVDRAGRSFFDPPPDFRLFPGDRVVLLGDDESLRKGRAFLEIREMEAADEEERFSIDQMAVSRNPEMAGKTLADLNLRQEYGVTVIGIQRGEEKITAPSPREVLRETDILMVLGDSENISAATRASGQTRGI